MHKTHFCVHGHFYQPPREDPFTGKIPQEFGAGPYNDWTERIYHECYLSNARKGNFQKISFNIGPTLFAWMDEHHPETVKAITDQEEQVFQRIGLSNAMAQPYFHIIMPLASERDKHTMVQWGIRDYRHHFHRLPLGMWLPETAVDLPTLAVLAKHNIQFTILAPWQAKDPALDISQPYNIKIGENSEIVVFFYNSFLSGEISFNPSASANADAFVNNWLLPQIQLYKNEGEPFVLVASDGELYGHHQPFRDEFLGYLLDGAVEKAGINRVYPAQWLRDFPPNQYTNIIENTSWSCHHGIERWRDVCGDAPTATWKKPLRQFLDALALQIDNTYESRLQGLIHNVWELRDKYIDALLGITPLESLIAAHAIQPLTPGQLEMTKLLIRAQYERLRMFSSDAWFFYDLDRIEPFNALKYAAHATSLVEQATGEDPSADIMDIIAPAHSQVSGVSGEMAFLGFLKKFENLARNAPFI